VLEGIQIRLELLREGSDRNFATFKRLEVGNWPETLRLLNQIVKGDSVTALPSKEVDLNSDV
jgi:hypothetical protein